MKNIETRRKLNNLKKALLIAGFTAGITACSKQEYNVPEGYALIQDEDGNKYGMKETYSYEYIQPTKVEYVDENGETKVDYVVPEGYELVVNTDENGKCYYMGIKKIKVTETIEATETGKQKIR